MTTTTIPRHQKKVLLLEGLHPSCQETLTAAGYQNFEIHSSALTKDELRIAIKDAYFVGIRSHTHLTEEILKQAPQLVAIGCFCIGTNQVDLKAATKQGIPVFNAPFSNTRSVAELVIAEIILLLRGIPEKNAMAHRGQWLKSATLSREARGKRLGIIGYGHIGTQLGILAEGLGMKVSFYDIENKLPLGNAQQCGSMAELLAQSDVVSLHVPETPNTQNMIDSPQMKQMKQGAILINAARGTVVNIEALSEALQSKHLSGAAVDVFPLEPKSNKDPFQSQLQAFDNVILTPHIGGSTLEAQENIGVEVASKLSKYAINGTSLSAVNFPQVSLPEHKEVSRLLHIHENRPGMLTHINSIFAEAKINISGQYLQTMSEIGYVVIDIETNLTQAEAILVALKAIDGTIRARLIHADES